MRSCGKILRLFVATALCALATIAVSCQKGDESGQGTEEVRLALTVPLPEVDSGASSQFVSISAPGAWTLSLDFGGAQYEWASLSAASGTGSGTVTLKWESNADNEARSLKLVLLCEGRSVSATLAQGAGSDPRPQRSPPTPPDCGWSCPPWMMRICISSPVR